MGAGGLSPLTFQEIVPGSLTLQEVGAVRVLGLCISCRRGGSGEDVPRLPLAGLQGKRFHIAPQPLPACGRNSLSPSSQPGDRYTPPKYGTLYSHADLVPKFCL
jgi:hypothetical protein